MPSIKRRRGRDESSSLPAAKQFKINDFFCNSVDTDNSPSENDPLSYAVEISNRYSVLETSFEEVVVNAHTKVDMRKAGTSQIETDTSSGGNGYPPVDSLLPLTARTVDCLFNSIRDLRGQIRQLIAAVMKLSSCILHDQVKAPEGATYEQNVKSNEQPHFNPQTNNTSDCNDPNKNTYHLVYQPQRIALTIRGTYGSVPSWLTIHQAKKHLAAALKLKQADINLSEVEVLNAQQQFQRVILSFASHKLPALLLKKRSVLCKMGIFPGRVFRNLTVAPLFSKKRTKCAPLLKPSTALSKPAEISRINLISWDETTTDDLVMQKDPKVPCSQSHSQVCLPSSDFNDSNAVLTLTPLVKSMEDEMFSSFGTLATNDQQSVIDRLHFISHKLQEVKDSTSCLEANATNLLCPTTSVDPIETGVSEMAMNYPRVMRMLLSNSNKPRADKSPPKTRKRNI